MNVMSANRILATARRLRATATPEERILWYHLRRDAFGARFRRQYPIPPHIADFACVPARVVVEVDGGQHGGSSDAARDAAMQAVGWRVLRYWNSDGRGNLSGVLAEIARVVEERLRER